jgi:hypothetical protein
MDNLTELREVGVKLVCEGKKLEDAFLVPSGKTDTEPTITEMDCWGG